MDNPCILFYDWHCFSSLALHGFQHRNITITTINLYFFHPILPIYEKKYDIYFLLLGENFRKPQGKRKLFYRIYRN